MWYLGCSSALRGCCSDRSAFAAVLLCGGRSSERWSCGSQSALFIRRAVHLRLPRILETASSLGSILTARCHLSSGVIEDSETTWAHGMAERYGPGNYQLFRPLYKDLCDEIRREYVTKPPAPLPSGGRGEPMTSVRHVGSDTHATKNAQEMREVAGGHVAPCVTKERRDCDAASSVRPVAFPEVRYGDGSWSVTYQPTNNLAVFRRDAIKETRQARVMAFSPVEVKDPPKLNAFLTFLNWYPIEVLIERNSVILHFSLSCHEGGMHMRNLRVYDAAATPLLMACTDDAQWVRQNLFYDGPCLWHLELDFQNELYDTMQDHGIDLNWARWVSQWVFYLEHVQYLKWNMGLLEELIPSDQRGVEEDFLLEREKAALDEPVGETLPGHSV